jgi:signal peptidase I
MTLDAAAEDDPSLRDRAGCELVAEALRAGIETRIRVTGTSMLPAVWPGDILRVRPAAEVSPGKGSVVLFLREGRLCAHRVVGRSSAQLITCGDAVPDCDAPVAVADVLGVVTGLIREGESERPPGLPSVAQAMTALAIRHSNLAYRLVLRMHQWKHPRRPAFRLTCWKPVSLGQRK